MINTVRGFCLFIKKFFKMDKKIKACIVISLLLCINIIEFGSIILIQRIQNKEKLFIFLMPFIDTHRHLKAFSKFKDNPQDYNPEQMSPLSIKIIQDKGIINYSFNPDEICMLLLYLLQKEKIKINKYQIDSFISEIIKNRQIIMFKHNKINKYKSIDLYLKSNNFEQSLNYRKNIRELFDERILKDNDNF